jgi:hypothetical protein
LSSFSEKPIEPTKLEIVEGNRWDYVLQLSAADPRNWSSYGAAGTLILRALSQKVVAPAHRSYWGSKDLMLFILEHSCN